MKNTLADYVEAIGELPYPPPILLETPNQQWLFNNLRLCRKGQSLWLRLLVLSQPLPPEALREYFHCQLLAKASKAFLDLTNGLYPRAALLQDFFESPADVWFISELLGSQRAVEESGLLGLRRVARGKTEWLQEQQWILEQIGTFNFGREKFVGAKSSKKFTLQDMLARLALQIAQEDSFFKRDYYQPFFRAYRNVLSDAKRCKYVQEVCLTPDDQLFIGGDGKRLPKDVTKPLHHETVLLQKSLKS